MPIFEMSAGNEAKFADFSGKLVKITEALKNAGDPADIKALEKIGADFDAQIHNFFRTERKLNIGVMGQVKAGKSSFLNTLLFGGKEVLPRASTPKTATLTKIEYSAQNSIEIEYYSRGDWDLIESNARVDSEDIEYKSARELVAMAKSSGINTSCFGQVERVGFDSYDALTQKLNDYVGENGKFTPIVKSVVLFANNDFFRGLSVVDTPGLNDPVASRTLRTQDFIKVCDVVFFLSQSGEFLSKSDWTLVSTQLPNEGVNRLVLVASKYDSGLRDVLRENAKDDIFGDSRNEADNIPDACKLVKASLTQRAAELVEEQRNFLIQREASEGIIKTIAQCKNPLCFSALAKNMIGKKVADLTPEELNLYSALDKFSDDLQKELPLVAGFDALKAVFDSVVSEKEAILQEKMAGFVPAATSKLCTQLEAIKEKAQKRLTLLSGSDKKRLLDMKRETETRINSIKADVKTLVGEFLARLNTGRTDAVRKLRENVIDSSSINERTGNETITVTEPYWVPARKFLWIFTIEEGYWKEKKRSKEVSYSYLDASDIVSNIRAFTMQGANLIEEVFTETVNMQDMKRRLLNAVANNFDMANENYDASLFRLIVEEYINKIEFPVIAVDCSKEAETIASQFSGEIRSSDKRTNLLSALDNTISKIFDALTKQLETSLTAFKTALSDIGEGLQKDLLADISNEFDAIIEQLNEREENIKLTEGYIKLIEQKLQDARA
jgi:hypothetical protein